MLKFPDMNTNSECERTFLLENRSNVPIRCHTRIDNDVGVDAAPPFFFKETRARIERSNIFGFDSAAKDRRSMKSRGQSRGGFGGEDGGGVVAIGGGSTASNFGEAGMLPTNGSASNENSENSQSAEQQLVQQTPQRPEQHDLVKVLPPWSRSEVTVGFCSAVKAMCNNLLDIRFNDPFNPKSTIPLFFGALECSCGNPDVTIEPSMVDFGDVLVGSKSSAFITIENKGSGLAHLVALVSRPFSVDKLHFEVGRAKDRWATVQNITAASTNMGLFGKDSRTRELLEGKGNGDFLSEESNSVVQLQVTFEPRKRGQFAKSLILIQDGNVHVVTILGRSGIMQVESNLGKPVVYPGVELLEDRSRIVAENSINLGTITMNEGTEFPFLLRNTGTLDLTIQNIVSNSASLVWLPADNLRGNDAAKVLDGDLHFGDDSDSRRAVDWDEIDYQLSKISKGERHRAASVESAADRDVFELPMTLQPQQEIDLMLLLSCQAAGHTSMDLTIWCVDKGEELPEVRGNDKDEHENNAKQVVSAEEEKNKMSDAADKDVTETRASTSENVINTKGATAVATSEGMGTSTTVSLSNASNATISLNANAKERFKFTFEAVFQPRLKFSAETLDFGVVPVKQQGTERISFTNDGVVPMRWRINTISRELIHPHAEELGEAANMQVNNTLFSMHPSEGILAPLKTQVVSISFTPVIPHFQAVYVIQLVTEFSDAKSECKLVGIGGTSRLRLVEINNDDEEELVKKLNVDFGCIKVGSEKTLDVVLANDGELQCNFNIQLDHDRFTVVPASGSIKAKSSTTLQCSFEPLHDRRVAHRAMIHSGKYGEAPLTLRMVGSGGHPELKVKDKVVEYELALLECENKRPLRLYNEGTAEASVTLETFADTTWSIPEPPFVVPPRGHIDITLVHCPVEVINFEERIVLKSLETIADVFTVMLRGTVGVPKLALEPEDAFQRFDFGVALINHVHRRSFSLVNSGNIDLDFECYFLRPKAVAQEPQRPGKSRRNSVLEMRRRRRTSIVAQKRQSLAVAGGEEMWLKTLERGGENEFERVAPSGELVVEPRLGVVKKGSVLHFNVTYYPREKEKMTRAVLVLKNSYKMFRGLVKGVGGDPMMETDIRHLLNTLNFGVCKAGGTFVQNFKIMNPGNIGCEFF